MNEQDLQQQGSPEPVENTGAPTAPETTSPAQALTEIEQPKRENGIQRRIRELVEERNAERAERQRLTERLLQREAPQQSTTSQAQEGPPTLDKFDTYEKYVAAYARWEAKQVIAEERAAQERQTQETKYRDMISSQQKQVMAQQTQLQTVIEGAERKYPDFYDKVFNPSLPVTPVIGQAMLESDVGADVMYHLATHPAELERIAKLSPTSQLREFGKLELTLAKQASTAPAPLAGLSGKSTAATDKPSEKDDMAAWIAKRSKQVHRRP
jgi:hypothetical protein